MRKKNLVICDKLDNPGIFENEKCAIVYYNNICNGTIAQYKLKQYYYEYMLDFESILLNRQVNIQAEMKNFSTVNLTYFSSLIESLPSDFKTLYKNYNFRSNEKRKNNFWYTLFEIFSGAYNEYIGRTNYKNNCVCTSNKGHNYWLECITDIVNKIDKFLREILLEMVINENSDINKISRLIETEFTMNKINFSPTDFFGRSCSIEVSLSWIYLLNKIGHPLKTYITIFNTFEQFNFDTINILKKYIISILKSGRTVFQYNNLSEIEKYLGGVYIIFKDEIESFIKKVIERDVKNILSEV